MTDRPTNHLWDDLVLPLRSEAPLEHPTPQSYRMTLNQVLNTLTFIIMQITGSSAIANVNFTDTNSVGITFCSQDKEYEFLAKDSNLVENGVRNALAKGDSVGRLIASYRAEGQLTAV